MPRFVKLPPEDRHNLALLRRVHPADWVNPEPAPRYNLVVIGAGTAGLVAAAGAAGLGARVALIEKDLLGGDCLNYGCVPSKALIRSARAFAQVRDAERFGVRVPEGTRVDFPAVMERLRHLRSEIARHDSAERFRELGIDVFLGEGHFVDQNRIEVEDRELRFQKALIATGARASLPSIPGLEEAGCLTNETLFSLTELPRRLAVIGGGPIGSEMAQAFARFGAQVSLLEREPHILPREDPDASQRVEKAFRRDGVHLLTGSRVGRVAEVDGEKCIWYTRDGVQDVVRVDAILVGLGRAPNVESLHLEEAGIEYDERRGVRVDDTLRTSNRRVYAAGDIASRFKFTHAADAMARVVIQNALFFGRRKASALTIPWSTYTDPELAHVGLGEKEAAAEEVPITTFVQELRDVDRAVLDGEDGGLVKVHVRQGSDEIVGATIVASHAGDMISELTVAMVNGIGLGTLAKTIHPYPTQTEAIKKVADAYNRTRLTPLVRSLLEKWFVWWRGGPLRAKEPASGGTQTEKEAA